MNVEERDGLQPRPRKTVQGNPWSHANAQEENYERQPIYRATKDGGIHQGGEDKHSAPVGRRPRIKDVQRVNYDRPRPYNPPDERRDYPPRYPSSSDPGERRPYHSRPQQQDRPSYQQDRPSYQQDRPSYQQDRPSYQQDRPSYPPRYSQQGGGEYNNGNRTPYQGGGGDYGGGNRSSYSQRPNTGGGYQGRPRTNDYDQRGNRPAYNAGPNQRGGGYDLRNPNKKRPQQGGRPNPNAKYSQRKQLKYKEALTDPNEPIRLNKFLANAGVCSRREADEFIQAGVIRVNGNVVTELGTKITRMDAVMFHEQPVQIESKLYVLLNKPKNCMTTSDDPQERLTVMDLVKSACKERIYPVGRLDRNTTGVLLLTNDGDLAAKLTHPSFKKKKIYHVWLEKEIAIEDMEKLANGIELEDGEIHADAISYANEEDKSQVGIEIHSGRNRIVRRMFEALGYRVFKLDRVYFAGLTKKNLPRGKWRYLNEQEVNALRMGAFE
ncbi:MAG: RNA-binding S4 domain-containing protein [Tannerella sp.]|jgi:23S rRNA pseudouridine2605 synthase|nr:RNA-binding S4 domain-containing protein [Tannerella sp.]